MNLEWIIFLAGLTIFLVIKIRKVILGDKPEDKEDGAKGGEPKESFIKRLNLLQKWSIKRIVGWAFAIFLGFEVVMWVFDGPDLSVIRRLVDYARRNDSAHTSKIIGQRTMEEEVKPYREELEKIRSKEILHQEDFAKSKELEKKIGNIEAKYDPAKRSAGLQLSRALLGDIYINLKSEGYSTSAQITHLDEQRLSISCVLSDKGFLGRIGAEWSEEQKCYMGTWTTPYKKGQIRLVPFSDPLGLVYRFDGTHKNDSDDKWMELTITHRGDYESLKTRTMTSCR